MALIIKIKEKIFFTLDVIFESLKIFEGKLWYDLMKTTIRGLKLHPEKIFYSKTIP